MSRAKWKGPYVEHMLIDSINKQNKNNIFTTSRKSTITPNFVGKNINVHNGKNYISVKVTEKMIGRKLGEFSPTRKRFSFKKNK